MQKCEHEKDKRKRFNYNRGKIVLGANKEEKVYSTGQVAKIFNVTLQTVVNWCNDGRLAYHTFTKGNSRYAHRRIKESDIRRMINERVDYFEPKKTVQVPGSVIPMIDNQIRIWNQQSSQARADGKDDLANTVDAWIEGITTARRIVDRSITEVDLQQYREEGVDYFL